jgi:hypothetical protein
LTEGSIQGRVGQLRIIDSHFHDRDVLNTVFLQALAESRDRRVVDLDGEHAFGCIQEWFKRRGNHAEVIANEMYFHLYRRVKVIWYEPAPEVDSTALFTRLNIGRIPLTNAELVKALLLARSREGGAASRRQIEIGMQWDGIEGLRAFLTNRVPTDYPTRIELLFDLMVERKTSDRLHTFHPSWHRQPGSCDRIQTLNVKFSGLNCTADPDTGGRHLRRSRGTTAHSEDARRQCVQLPQVGRRRRCPHHQGRSAREGFGQSRCHIRLTGRRSGVHRRRFAAGGGNPPGEGHEHHRGYPVATRG